MGLCVAAEEPAHCEDGHGWVSAKKYIGKYVGDYQCDYVLVEGQKVYLEDNADEVDWSHAYPLGCNG